MNRNRVEVMHGVNLDQLGRRDPVHYGRLSLAELERVVDGYARDVGLEARFFQTNIEHEFIGRLHRADGLTDALVLNPGAWTHYSYAIRDALEIAGLPAVEVHLSDVRAREEWRRHSVISELCLETVSGLGPEGYRVAFERLRAELEGERA